MYFFLPKNHGVLGINARNLNYLKPFNPRKAVAFADDKLKTKVFLEARGVPVPKLYAKVGNRGELRNFDFSSLPDACVLKPNFGYGGEGIIILQKREQGGWRTGGGGHMNYRELAEHCEDILDGMYSMNHRRDIAFFEQNIVAHDCFSALTPVGLPDIRIIAHNMVPVMSMLRLPTAESSGKANVHVGGIGIGIDIAKGSTTFAVQKNKLISELPNGRSVGGFKIPYWEDMLLAASRIQKITNIGFLGVDFTIDADSGPVLLEVNARAGLMLQIANLAPLKKRLERVEGLNVSSPEKGVRIAQDLFGEKVESRNAEAGQKPVLGTRETIEILGGGQSIAVSAILRPDHDRTVFDPSIIPKLKNAGAIELTDDGNMRVKFMLGGKKLQTIAFPHEIGEEGVQASLGRRDLKDFLVDPGKKTLITPLKTYVDLRRTDKQLADIDRKIQLLKHIRPSNLEEERRKIEKDAGYNPRFIYAPLAFDAGDLIDRMSYLEADDSPLGVLLNKKKVEIAKKIRLLQARGNNPVFTVASKDLYGAPIATLVKDARAFLHDRQWRKGSPKKQEMLPAEKVSEIFSDVLLSYGLRDWSVAIKSCSVSDCSVGGKKIVLRKGGLFSRERVESLIAHEIETHVLTAVNGEKQPYEIFRRGMAGYLETQEGLAIYNQNAVLPRDHEKRYWPAVDVLAVKYGLEHSFSELRSYVRRLGFGDKMAIRTCLKIKRGMGDTALDGAFTKELLYFRGLRVIESFLEDGGEIKDLYIGRINVRDIEAIKEIAGLIDPVYLPKSKGRE